MRKPTAFIAALLLTAGLAACSDGSDDGDGSATGAGDTSTATPAEGADDAPAAGGTVTVEIGDFAFDPTPIEITAGQSVVWENTHSQAHTSTGQGDQAWDTQNIAPGASSEPVLFEDAGTFTYICALHPFMEGTVEVSA